MVMPANIFIKGVKEMTVYEKLKDMSIQQVAQFLNKLQDYDNLPWYELFSSKYCNKCEPVIKRSNAFGFNVEVEYAPCETEVGCPFGVYNLSEEETIKQWLLSEWSDDYYE